MFPVAAGECIRSSLGQAWFEAAQNTGSGVELLPDYRGYAYDPIGNRTGADAKDPDTGTLLPTAYAANALNQYTEVAPPLGPPQPLAHDEDGNLASFDAADATWLYAYDAENRLAAVEPQSPTTGDAKLALRYDYLGRRVQKVVSTYTGGLWVETSDTRFVYDGWNLVEERDAAGAVQNTYVWGLDLSNTLQGAGGIGGLLAVIEGPAVRYVLPDANGNVGHLIDAATGTVAAHYEYDPFGNVAYASGVAAEDNPFRFSTKYLDQETNLYYYGYRYYSPELGRWLNRDPIGERGGRNLYAFTSNNPINLIDILGLLDGGFGFAWPGEKGFFMDMAGGRNDPNVTSGDSGKDVLNHLKELTKKLDCDDCIREYKIAGHGRHQPRPSMPSPKNGPNGIFGPSDPEHSVRGPYAISTNDIKTATQKTTSTTGGKQQVIDEEVKFCDDCVIKVYGCNLAPLTQALSAATGCRVIAAGGYCSPTEDGDWFTDDWKPGDPGPGDQWYESDNGGTPAPIGGPIYDPN